MESQLLTLLTICQKNI